MTAAEIRKHFAPDTLLKRDNQEFATAVMLAEIAAQLAELNHFFECFLVEYQNNGSI